MSEKLTQRLPYTGVISKDMLVHVVSDPSGTPASWKSTLDYMGLWQEIPNTVFVSTIGSDTTGKATLRSRPFATANAALAALGSVSSGSFVNLVIESGTYTSEIDIDSLTISGTVNLNIIAVQGAKYQNEVTAIIYASSAINVNLSIYGGLTIEATGGICVDGTNLLSVKVYQATSITNTTGLCFKNNIDLLKDIDIIQSETSNCVLEESTNSVEIINCKLKSTSDDCISLNGGDLTAVNSYVISEGTDGIGALLTGEGKANLTGCEVTGANRAIKAARGINVNSCKLKSTDAGEAILEITDTLSGDIINILGSVLIGEASVTIPVDNSSGVNNAKLIMTGSQSNQTGVLTGIDFDVIAPTDGLFQDLDINANFLSY